MNTQNYKDFYQKALVPIGEKDHSSFKETTPSNQHHHSHWLIALVGEQENIEKEFYSWKVTIFPSDSNGSFSWKSPCYLSTIFDCIHLAYKHALELETFSKNDELYSSNKFQTIIS